MTNTDPVKIQLLTELAILPTRHIPESIGLDLYSAETTEILPWSTAKIRTDLAIQVPEGTYGRIAPRSGLSLQGVLVIGGVIDRDYRGNVGIALFNLTNDTVQIAHGARIAQLICERASLSELQVVAVLPETSRGVLGFGSSGV